MPGISDKEVGLQCVSPCEEEDPVEEVKDEEEYREECQEEQVKTGCSDLLLQRIKDWH